MAEAIIALEDPFLPLISIAKLVRTKGLVSLDDDSLSNELVSATWEELSKYVAWSENRQGLCWFEVPTDFPLMVAGVACELPDESLSRAELRDRWKQVLAFNARMSDMSPEQFEELGKEILGWYGVTQPMVTRISGDGGLDFIGEGRLGEVVGLAANEWTVVDACKVVFIGQAKKYDSLVVGTPELRELIGSVVLMQKDSYRAKYGYDALAWNLMQPRVLLFITTSRFSAEAVRLAEEAGVILADRNQICRIYWKKISHSTAP